MPIAFKEWAVTVRALAEGEQSSPSARVAFASPTSTSNWITSVSSSIRRSTTSAPTGARLTPAELTRALEEGVWSDGQPSPSALHRGDELSQPDRVRIRAWAEVFAHFTVTDRRAVDALSPFYVWTTDYAERNGSAWKRRHRSM